MGASCAGDAEIKPRQDLSYVLRASDVVTQLRSSATQLVSPRNTAPKPAPPKPAPAATAPEPPDAWPTKAVQCSNQLCVWLFAQRNRITTGLQVCGVVLAAMLYYTAQLLPPPPATSWCLPGSAICWESDPKTHSWLSTVSIVVIPIGLAAIQLATVVTAGPLSHTLGTTARRLGTVQLFGFGWSFGIILAAATTTRCRMPPPGLV